MKSALALGTLVALSWSMSPNAHAQDPITPDRPGIGSGSTVLAPGIVHLEGGVSQSSAGGLDQYAIGELLLRLGVSGVELELFLNSFVVQRGEELPVLDETGFQDIGLGIKIPVARDLGDRMDLSLQGVLTVPTGSDTFTNDEWIGGVTALADVSLADGAGVSVNLGVQEGVGASGEVYSLIVTPGVSLGRGVGVYGGWAGFFTEGPDNHFAEGGLTFLPSTDVQLDVNAGWSTDTDEWFVGAGMAVRWGA